MTDTEEQFQAEPITLDFVPTKSSQILNKVIKLVCASLNTAGNKQAIVLKCDDQDSKQIDTLKMSIENKIKNILGPPVLIDYINIYDSTLIKQEEDRGSETRQFGNQSCTERNLKMLIVEVTPSVQFVTLNYNFYFPTSSQIMKLNSWSFRNITQMMRSHFETDSQILQTEEAIKFILDQEFKQSESNTTQFKHFPNKPGKSPPAVESLTDKIESCITQYISAFANHKGGRIYFGIEDKNLKIKGQTISKEDQTALTENIKKMLNDMTWGKDETKKPQERKDWAIQYIPVVSRSNCTTTNLFVIVVTIRKFPGGVFSKCPESYELDQQNEPVLIKYEQWRKRMQLPVKSFIQCKQDIDQDARRRCFELINEVEICLSQGYGVDTAENIVNEKLRTLQEPNSSINVEILTCYAELAYIGYCSGDLDKCCKNLRKVHEKLNSTCNTSLLYLHYTCLQACLARRMDELDKSLRLTYDCLVETHSIFPGWENAAVWKTHGTTLAEFASNETKAFMIKKRVEAAEYAWSKAIEHAQELIILPIERAEAANSSVALINVIHLSHLYVAFLYLGYSPSGKEIRHEIQTDTVTEAVKQRLQAIYVTKAFGYSLSFRCKGLIFIILYLSNLRNEDKKKYAKNLGVSLERNKSIENELKDASSLIGNLSEFPKILQFVKKLTSTQRDAR